MAISQRAWIGGEATDDGSSWAWIEIDEGAHRSGGWLPPASSGAVVFPDAPGPVPFVAAAPIAPLATAAPQAANGDIPGDTSSTATLEAISPTPSTFVGSLSGRLEFGGDHDWIRVTLNAGIPYQFFLSFLEAGTSASGDSVLRLRDGAGNEITVNDDAAAGDANSFIQFTPIVGGIYFLDVGAAGDSDVGDYSLFAMTGSVAPTFLTAGDDSYTGEQLEVTIVGQHGDDTLSVDPLNDRHLLGEQGDDVLTGNGSHNRMSGGLGHDVLDGSGGDDFLFGDAGDDSLTGGTGSDVLFGGAGNDLLSGGEAADEMRGGDGDDTYNVDNAGDTVIEAASAGHDIVLTTVSFALPANVEDLLLTEAGGATNGTGNSLANNMTGNSAANTLSGGAGNDVLSGAGGNDTLIGGSGADQLLGGAGIDTAGYTGSNAAVAVNLKTGTGSGGHAAGDTLNKVENVIGSGFNDTLIGNGANNTLNGGAGNDSLSGANGSDTLLGAAGNDTLIGGAGADVLNGGADFDTASYAQSDGAVVVDLASGTAIGGHAAGDTLSGIEKVIGSAFNDTLLGNGQANSLHGGAGNDTLDGSAGNDFLVGGAGNDTYVYGNNYGFDTAADYQPGNDRFDLTGVSGLDDYDDVRALMVQNGAHVHIDFGGGNTLRILNTTIATLDANQGDFLV
jgi:Ca2+-binding RTX toxin-like protein